MCIRDRGIIVVEAQELRVQPHDLVAEQSVLGAILINPEKLITVREFIEADEDVYKRQVSCRPYP